MKRAISTLQFAIVLSFAASVSSGVTADERIESLSPEDVVRYSNIAIIHGDLDRLRQYAVQKSDLRLLVWKPLKGTNATEALGLIGAYMLYAKFKRLGVDDTFTLPDGKEVKVTDEMVNGDRCMLLLVTGKETIPRQNPVILLKTKKGWKRDFSAEIAQRKSEGSSEKP